jgi:hypothetical protein
MASCDFCQKKKVGIVSFNCKCSFQNLCAKCRIPENHNCTFDYKKEGREQLIKHLPLIVHSKIDKI